GVFGYSDEDGTEAETYADKLPETVIQERVELVTGLVEQLTAQRAADRVGELVSVLVEESEEGEDGVVVTGRAEQQGPDVDGSTILVGWSPQERPAVGDIVSARVTGTEGVDLIARVVADAEAPPS